MFEEAKIRRNWKEIEAKFKDVGDDVLFYPLKTIRDTVHFHHLLRRLEAYHGLVLEHKEPLDRKNLKREIMQFLDELKAELGVTKSKKMRPHFELLIAGAGVLAELM